MSIIFLDSKKSYRDDGKDYPTGQVELRSNEINVNSKLRKPDRLYIAALLETIVTVATIDTIVSTSYRCIRS